MLSVNGALSWLHFHDLTTRFEVQRTATRERLVEQAFALRTDFGLRLQALAGMLVAPGARQVAMTRDVLDLWHRQIAPACQRGALSIAGVTTERGFFLLHTLAADLRRRVLSRSHHGALVSWLIGRK